MEAYYRLALSFANGVGPIIGRKLISLFGSAEKLLKADSKELNKLKGLRQETISSLKGEAILRSADRELKFIEKENITLLTDLDKEYPKRLLQCPDAPLILYYKGKADLNAQRIISIVGTRNATSYGRSLCNDFTAELSAYDPILISGLAYGIDSYAHQGAVNNDIPTVGVLGNGLDSIYPQSHSRLAKNMLEKGGGLLSEFPCYTKPERQNFPMRNRIIAGLADIILVIEAAKKGGALITAELANSYNRDVGAFPGNIYQEHSEGCNHLIKTNRAFPITNIKDLEYLMSWEPLDRGFGKNKKRQDPLNPTEQEIFSFLEINGPAKMDIIMNHTGLEISSLAIHLLQMELKERVIALPGQIYSLRI